MVNRSDILAARDAALACLDTLQHASAELEARAAELTRQFGEEVESVQQHRHNWCILLQKAG